MDDQHTLIRIILDKITNGYIIRIMFDDGCLETHIAVNYEDALRIQQQQLETAP